MNCTNKKRHYIKHFLLLFLLYSNLIEQTYTNAARFQFLVSFLLEIIIIFIFISVHWRMYVIFIMTYIYGFVNFVILAILCVHESLWMVIISDDYFVYLILLILRLIVTSWWCLSRFFGDVTRHELKTQMRFKSGEITLHFNYFLINWSSRAIKQWNEVQNKTIIHDFILYTASFFVVFVF